MHKVKCERYVRLYSEGCLHHPVALLINRLYYYNPSYDFTACNQLGIYSHAWVCNS